MVTEEMVRRRLVPLVQEGALLVSEIHVAPSPIGKATAQVRILRAPTSKVPDDRLDLLVRDAVADLDVVLIVNRGNERPKQP